MEDYINQKANLINQIQLQNYIEIRHYRKNHSFYFTCFEELCIIALREKIHFKLLNTLQKNAIVNVSVSTHNLVFSLTSSRCSDVQPSLGITGTRDRSDTNRTLKKPIKVSIDIYLQFWVFCHFMDTVYFNLCKNVPISLTETEKLKSNV